MVERAVGPEAVLHGGDIVWFVCERNSIASIRRIPGLEDVEINQVDRLNLAPQQRRLIEAVISLRSDLLYKTVKEARFRYVGAPFPPLLGAAD